MDPAFPDLVAATAAEEAEELHCNSPLPARRRNGAPEMPEIMADLLRLLARLW